MDCKKTCKKFFRTGETACKRCSRITEVEETDEGLDADGDEETEEDEEEDTNEEEDAFHNIGKKLFWVPIRFRTKGTDVTGRVIIAADDEDEARERAEDLEIDDIMDGCDDIEDVDCESFILETIDNSDATAEIETDPNRVVEEV